MSDYKEIIGRLQAIAQEPSVQTAELKRKTGKKLVGCLPAYTPGEIVYALDMIPVGLWGGQVEISLAKEYVPAFTCSIMQSILELGLRGSYKELSAVIVPSLCDTLKCIGQDIKAGCKDLRVIQFTHPQNRRIEPGVEFLKKEYLRSAAALEEISGSKLTEERLSDAIEVFNTNRAALRRFTGLAADHTDVISPTVRHAVIKSGYFMEKPEHTALVTELCQALSALPVSREGKRVLLTGIMAEPGALLDILTENGVSVVADDLAQESRQFRCDVPTEGGDAITRLAKWWQVFEGCSLAYDAEKKRFDMIGADVEKYGADGVIICMMKFCDPEEYDYPLLKTYLAEREIPELYMEIDQQADITAQAGTRIQGFAEILSV